MNGSLNFENNSFSVGYFPSYFDVGLLLSVVGLNYQNYTEEVCYVMILEGNFSVKNNSLFGYIECLYIRYNYILNVNILIGLSMIRVLTSYTKSAHNVLIHNNSEISCRNSIFSIEF